MFKHSFASCLNRFSIVRSFLQVLRKLHQGSFTALLHTHWQMYHARDMADTVTTQETEIVFIGSRHWVQLLGFREEICVKTQLLPRCWCCRLYRRVSMWQQSHYRTMVQGISSAGVTDLTPPSPSWSQQMKGKYCSRWWIWIVETRIRIYRYADTLLQHTTVLRFEK